MRPGALTGAWGALCGPHVTRGWLAALVLLQDDDEDAREAMARAVSAAVARGGVQPAKAMEVVFEFLAAERPPQPRWEAYLSAALRVAGAQDGAGADGAGGAGGADFLVSDEAMARRLFEKECDNFQAEELIVVMLAARHRRGAGAGAGAAAAEEAAAQLAEYLGSLAGAGTATCWAGGVSSRSDIFLHVYRQLLAIWALGSGARLGPAGMAALGAAARALVGLEAHFLLRNALAHVAEDAGAREAAATALEGASGGSGGRLGLLFLLSSHA